MSKNPNRLFSPAIPTATVAARGLRVGLAILFVAVGPSAVRPQNVDSLDALKRLLLDGRYQEAERDARALLARTEAGAEPDAFQVARIIDALVEALWRGGKARASETGALAERAVAIKEQLLGADHPDLAYSLTSLGIVLRLRGDYSRARSLFDQALDIQEKVLGPTHVDVAHTLTVSAGLATDMGELGRAQALYERALQIRQERLGAADRTVADTVNGLGVVRERMGDIASAEQHHQRALEIRQRALGAAHPDVAASLNNLANIRSEAGDYAAARSLHERALAIREKALGLVHPDVAASLNNLAIAVRDLGDHTAAWWLLERVLAIWEIAYGPDHPNIAIACQNLAAILVDVDEDVGRRLLAERSRRIRARTGDSGGLAKSLNTLAGFETSHRYAAARALLERALAIKENALGASHTSVALTLTSLANVTWQSGDVAAVRPLYERALEIREKAFGPMHGDVADSLDRLGEFLVDIGDAAAARPIYERVLTIIDTVHGPDHPHAGVIRQHLAEVFAATGDAAAAIRMALEAERIGREHLRLIGRALPEREALMYAATRPAGLDVALTLLVQEKSESSAWRAEVVDAVVRSRAIVLDEMASRQRAVDVSSQADVVGLLKTLTAKREQLARLIVRGPGESGQQYPVDLQRARVERDEAERALAERSLAFRREQREVRFGLEELHAALPPQSALIGFVRYLQQQPRTLKESRAAQPVASYMAFIVRADDFRRPSVIPLGTAHDVEGDILRWRKLMMPVALTTASAVSRAESAVRSAGLQLRAKIWDPLAAHLTDVNRVFIVPDGSLHLVNWDALPNAGGGYLIEQAPPIHYLSAERDLAAEEQPAFGGGLLVVDSPAFSIRPREAARINVPAPGTSGSAAASSAATSFRGATLDCGDLGWLRFDDLPASAREAETIVRIWQGTPETGGAPRGVSSSVPAGRPPATAVQRLSGRAASESAFKERAPGARVLHLATHAFFLGGRCTSTTSGRAPETRVMQGAPAENPLLLAGLALSGANRRQSAGARDEDGILTAEEVASLDLRGVEWAVLSGCDTGVGEVRAGEGVFGLRRAFRIAGARTVIMSLWPVTDDDSRRWMSSLYNYRFANGAATMEAVRGASLGQLKRRRQAGLSTHPFYWAGFIAAGDWR